MSDYTSNLDLPAAARLLAHPTGPVLVLTHAKPDGDAIGSAMALTLTLRGLGHTTRCVLVPPVPAALAQLPGADQLDVWDDGFTLAEEPAHVVIVDTGAWTQVGPMRPVIEPRLDRTLIVDHHLSGNIGAKHRYIDGTAAACAEIVAELIELLIHPAEPAGKRETDTAGYKTLPLEVRDALFVGIASDTGWFRFSNTRPNTHELAARLIRMGTDNAGLYQRLEQAERPEKLALVVRAMSSLQMFPDHHAAVMVLRAKDFEETGALPEETERLIDLPQVVSCIEVVALVTEAVIEEDGKSRSTARISFRSKPQLDEKGEDIAINVAELAGRFGGGGHARAAGAKVDRPVDDVLADVVSALQTL